MILVIHFFILRHKQPIPKLSTKFQTQTLAYAETEQNLSNDKLETCKPNHTNLKAFSWQLLQTDTNRTKLWGRCVSNRHASWQWKTAHQGKPWLRTQSV